jgi:hypothetical protein
VAQRGICIVCRPAKGHEAAYAAHGRLPDG